MVLTRATLLSEKWGSYSVMQKSTIQPFPHQRKLCRARNEWSINNSKHNFKAQPNGRPVRYAHSTSVRYRNVLTFVNTTAVGKKISRSHMILRVSTVASVAAHVPEYPYSSTQLHISYSSN